MESVKMNHAPTRPWHVKHTCIYGANKELVATVGVFTLEEDSTLIASAPDLLDALKRAHLCATIHDDGTCDGCAVSALIAKAEGR